VQVVYESPKVEMQRDMDLIRDLLILMEDDQRLDGTQWLEVKQADFPSQPLENVAYHVRLLVEAGFVRGNIGGDMPAVSRLTWEGHEFLDNIKDVGVWEKTKERLQGIPGVALTVVAALAEAEIKKRLGLAP
jgi:hypothetical protein